MKHLRIGLFIIAATFLSACGFKPMHAPSAFGGSGVSLQNIAVVTVNNEKIDFLLKQSLRDRMGGAPSSAYTLHIEPKLRRRTLGIGSDDVASRYDLTMEAKFELQNAKGEVVFKDKVRAISTFAAPRDPYGTIAAQNNATEQVAAETADRIIIRLARFTPGS